MKVDLQSQLTRNILITDGQITHLNVYGEFAAFIASAITTQPPFVQFRFQSEPFVLSSVTVEKWNEFEKKCLDHCEQSPVSGSPLNSIAKKMLL